MIDRVIAAICEHVIAEDALAGGDEGVGVDEAADLGVVITALQIIEPGILGKGLAIQSIFALLPLVFEYRKPEAFCKVIAGGSSQISWLQIWLL